MVKLAVLCLCAVHLVSVSAGLYPRKELQAARNGLTTKSEPPSAGSSNQVRQRPLFARRGQHEQQKLRVLKPGVAPVSPNDLPPPSKVASKPAKLRCSQLTQSCVPKSGCCGPRTTCHCHFFKSICFCRKIKELKPRRDK